MWRATAARPEYQWCKVTFGTYCSCCGFLGYSFGLAVGRRGLVYFPDPRQQIPWGWLQPLHTVRLSRQLWGRRSCSLCKSRFCEAVKVGSCLRVSLLPVPALVCAGLVPSHATVKNQRGGGRRRGSGGSSTRKSLPCVHNKKSWWLTLAVCVVLRCNCA